MTTGQFTGKRRVGGYLRRSYGRSSEANKNGFNYNDCPLLLCPCWVYGNQDVALSGRLAVAFTAGILCWDYYSRAFYRQNVCRKTMEKN